MSEEKKIDYLEVDDPIGGQNYACMSFISPESLIKDKEGFKVTKFLQSYCKENKLKFEEVYEQYKGFCYKHEDKLQRDFDESNDFQTSLRGIKVRGVFDTREAAENRAKKLSTLDSSFHVFIGQVGYWLPWDPNADKVESEHFQNSQLNDMMEKYQENNVNRDIFYEEQKRDKIKAAQEEALQKKKEAEKNIDMDNVDDYTIEKIEEEAPVLEDEGEKDIKEAVKDIVDDVTESKVVEEPEVTDDPKVTEEPKVAEEPEVTDESPEEISSDNKVSGDIIDKLEGDDPWMQKMKRESDE
jgi:hypothetical protein